MCGIRIYKRISRLNFVFPDGYPICYTQCCLDLHVIDSVGMIKRRLVHVQQDSHNVRKPDRHDLACIHCVNVHSLCERLAFDLINGFTDQLRIHPSYQHDTIDVLRTMLARADWGINWAGEGVGRGNH